MVIIDWRRRSATSKERQQSSLALIGSEIFFDHRLRGDESLIGKGQYIRQNPVRAGLVADKDEWHYVLDRIALEKMAVR